VKQVDVYAEITNKIIRAIEAGADEFKMPWHNSGGASVPVNAVTGKPYRGVNTIALWADAIDKNFSTGIWATYQQRQSLGAGVRKGERSSVIVFWKFIDDKNGDEEADGLNDGSIDDRRMLARAYRVFNADQVDGYSAPHHPQTPPGERNEQAEAFFAHLKAETPRWKPGLLQSRQRCHRHSVPRRECVLRNPGA
jgi:antirestriction protein ArdC